MTTQTEPEWDDEMRNLAVALDRCEQLELCPRCGQPSYICQDPARQFDWVSLPPVRCHAATATMRAQQAMSEETNPQIGALIWYGSVLREDVGDD